MPVLCVQEDSGRHAKRLPKLHLAISSACPGLDMLILPRQSCWEDSRAPPTIQFQWTGNVQSWVPVHHSWIGPLTKTPCTHMHQSLNPDRCAPEECTKPNAPRKKHLVQLHPVVEPSHSSPVACTLESHSPSDPPMSVQLHPGSTWPEASIHACEA